MMTTDNYINSKAEKQHVSDQLGYVDGLTHGLDISVGAMEWCIEHNVIKMQDGQYKRANYAELLNKSQLLCKYLDTLKTK